MCIRDSSITEEVIQETNLPDDSYSFDGLVINSYNAIDTVLSLPAASNISIKAGEIDAQDPNNNSLGKFPVNLLVSVNSDGIVSSTTTISGSDVIPGSELVDDPHKAQIAYWPPFHNTPTVEPDDADILNTKLTPSQLSNYYSSSLTVINNMYHAQNLISSWSINLNPMSRSTSNILSQHARFKNIVANNDIFLENDSIVCATPFSYSVAIEDYLGVQNLIIPATNIYGVIKHKN